MGESLVDAVLRSQARERDLELRNARGAEVPTDARPPRIVKKCACGCGRPLDPRNELGLSRTCIVGKLQVIWRRANPRLRKRLLRLLREP